MVLSPECTNFLNSCLKYEIKDRMTIMDLQRHPFIRKYGGSDQESVTMGRSDHFDSDAKTITANVKRAEDKVMKYRNQQMEIDENFSEGNSSHSYDSVDDKRNINMVSSLPYGGAHSKGEHKNGRRFFTNGGRFHT